MQILLPVDSRVANKGGFLLLDLERNSYEFQEFPFREDFKRAGFRGGFLKEETLYVVSSAALYFFRIASLSPLNLEHQRTVRRPEWELGERAAADLHHVMYSQSRDRLLVANTFMDAIDEVSLDGEWLGRRYLWDISPDVMSYTANRDRFAPDLVHVNFIEERENQHRATLCNINGTKEGAIVSLDTGAILQRGLSLPHDGQFHEDSFYVTNTGSSELLIYDAPTGPQESDIKPGDVVPIEVTNPEWDSANQWVRGVCVSDNFIMVGVTQFRGDNADPEARLAPPRIVVFDKQTRQQLGEVFLPITEGFTNPCIYSMFLLGDPGQEEIDFSRWSAPAGAYQPDPGEELTLPNPSFGGIRMQPDVSDDWQWKGEVDFVKLIESENGVQLGLEFGSSEGKAFLVSGAGMGRLIQPADNARSYRLPSKAEIMVEVWVPKLTPYARVGLYFVEYDLEFRVETSRLRLREGKNVLRIKRKDYAESFRIAFRLAGSGMVAIDRVRVCAYEEGAPGL